MPLTAYYFRGQDLCVVRRHIREDMKWMADVGTDYAAYMQSHHPDAYQAFAKRING